jgi:aldehyde dehydrogenase (NAD+)
MCVDLFLFSSGVLPKDWDQKMNIEELDNHRLKLKNSFRSGVTKTYEWRLQELQKVKSFLIDCEEEILAALKQDLGRCRLESWSMDYAGTLNEVETMIRNLK